MPPRPRSSGIHRSVARALRAPLAPACDLHVTASGRAPDFGPGFTSDLPVCEDPAWAVPVHREAGVVLFGRNKAVDYTVMEWKQVLFGSVVRIGRDRISSGS